MLHLGIETSCDETSVSVVRDGTNVLSCSIASQAKLHEKTGGVVPEVAAREHVSAIIPVVQDALNKAHVSLDDLDEIAVTKEPGLLPSLLIGLQTAKTLSFARKLPLKEIHHTHGHIYSNWLERDASEIRFPILILTVSGGHNDLILMKNHGDFEILGTTLDDAAGEAFDKVSRLLDLGYPGGPRISKAAEKGDLHAYNLPRAWLSDPSVDSEWDKKRIDFSFSGLKTAVLQLTQGKKLTSKDISDIAASFQEAVCDVLTEKLAYVAQKFEVAEVHLAGGVSANSRLRELAKERLQDNTPLRFPQKLEYCTDNGAMIAAAAYFV
jgi:N6-L-threonylcarbamoyladenine synthase